MFIVNIKLIRFVEKSNLKVYLLILMAIAFILLMSNLSNDKYHSKRTIVLNTIVLVQVSLV